jgi:hypothetical protein
MTVPRRLVAPALWGFGAGLLTLSIPGLLWPALLLAPLAAVLRLPRVGAFAGAAGATTAALLATVWARCQLSSAQPVCSDVATLAALAAVGAVIGVGAAFFWRSQLRA